MGTMGIGGILNAGRDTLMRQMQQPLHLDAHPPYSMDHTNPMVQRHQHPMHHQMHHQGHMPFGMNNSQHAPMMPANYMTSHSSATSHTLIEQDQIKPKNEPAPKAFACSTCQKGFARRSDLARHERIHSGVRPHACDYPGCGKQFIQRSALTVHARVHTGEKPHMCERCGKPFSDSSSLARHRRIHSGKRPYQCPFANCQKTFTRRTTLTRHQNNHAGTVEQAEAETNAKLGMTQSQTQPRSNNSSYSDAASRASDVSPTRPMSTSPHHEMAIPNMQKSNSEFSYMSQSQILPPHIRTNFHQNGSRLTQSMNTPTMSPFSAVPSSTSQLTSHPSSFRPQTLERSTSSTNDTGPGSHITAMSWPTDNTNSLASPTGMEQYSYHDTPSYGGHALYYQGSNIRRPQSTEPDEQFRTRFMGHHFNPNGIHMQSANDWGQLTMNSHEVKPERAFAG